MTTDAQAPAENGEVSTKRRMPEALRKTLVRMQGGKMYLTAAYRLVWFRDECPDWGVDTCILEGGHEAGFATVQAKVYNAEGRLIASGTKTETQKDFPAGWVEKSETGAIARALAVAGFGTQFAAELDDVGSHPADSPQGRHTPPSSARCAAPASAPAARKEAVAKPVSRYAALFGVLGERGVHWRNSVWERRHIADEEAARLDRLRIVGRLAGRDLTSLDDLTDRELATTMSHLRNMKDEELARVVNNEPDPPVDPEYDPFADE
jgi:hypothetical protein